jgi:hypothetical protein
MRGDRGEPFREPGSEGDGVMGVAAEMGVQTCLEEAVGAVSGLFIVDAGEAAEVALEFCSYLP